MAGDPRARIHAHGSGEGDEVVTVKRVDLHVHGDDQHTVLAALQVAENVHRELSGAEIEVVIQGAAVVSVMDMSDVTAAVQRAIRMQGISVALCRNSLRGAGKVDLPAPSGVHVVHAAVAHVARRQWDGWAYVRL